MLGIIAILIPILIVDVINPVLLAAVIFALGSRRPFLNANAILFGWFSLYFVAGIIIALGLDAIIDVIKNPRPIDFYIETVLGLLLLWLAIKNLLGKSTTKKQKEYGEAEDLKPLNSYWIGASINLIGLPFAIPYFAAIDQILKSDLEAFPAVIALLIYNLLYVFPFLLLLVIRAIYRDQSDALFSKINQVMDKIADVLIPIFLLLIGIALLTDAIFYFVTGQPLF